MGNKLKVLFSRLSDRYDQVPEWAIIITSLCISLIGLYLANVATEMAKIN